MKKKVLLFITLIILFVILSFIIFKLHEDKSNLKEEIVIQKVIFNNVKITKNNGEYDFEVTVSTDSSDTVKIESFDAFILNKDKKEISVLSGYVGNISKGETKTVKIKTTDNLDDAYYINYTVYQE